MHQNHFHASREDSNYTGYGMLKERQKVLSFLQPALPVYSDIDSRFEQAFTGSSQENSIAAEVPPPPSTNSQGEGDTGG